MPQDWQGRSGIKAKGILHDPERFNRRSFYQVWRMVIRCDGQTYVQLVGCQIFTQIFGKLTFDFYAYVRMLRGEGRNRAQQEGMGKIGWDANPDPAFECGFGEITNDIVIQAQHLPCIGSKGHACVSECELATGGVDEFCLQEIFQPPDLEADSRLRAAECFGGFREATEIHDGDKTAQQICGNVLDHDFYYKVLWKHIDNQFRKCLSTGYQFPDKGRFCVKRTDIEQLLKSDVPVVTPVIHVQDAAQALRNLDVLDGQGCPGAFLINHDFPVATFLPILREIRAVRPEMWLGINFLAQPGNIAFPILGELAREGADFDAYWADDGCIDERTTIQTDADDIARVRAESGWKGMYIGGVAFKKQRPVPEDRYADSARLAVPYMDVICTSGIATGHEADVSKIETFRAAVGDKPLALASGVTPENVHRYAPLVDLILVATGINYEGDFYNIDPARLSRLLEKTQRH